MLNCDKTYFMQFAATDQEISMQVLFGDRRIATAQIKFLGLTHYFRNLEALYY
jgi:hypothetical protein